MIKTLSTTVLSISLFCTHFLYSQNQPLNSSDAIGHYIGYYGELISGSYDDGDDLKEVITLKKIMGADYSPGYYYALNGERVDGLIKLMSTKPFVNFKKDLINEEVSLLPENCSGYVIGRDSFTVIQNFDIQRTTGAYHHDDRDFALVIDSVDNMTFLQHVLIGQNNIVQTFIIKQNGTLVSIPKGTLKFRKIASEIFADFPSLVHAINAGRYSEQDIPALIKVYKYKRHFDRHQRIALNSQMDECYKNELPSYFATIESMRDSVFHVSYSTAAGTKVYEADFSSFYPHKAKGTAKYYFTNGKIRKTISYVSFKASYFENYHSNGKLRQIYTMTEKEFGGRIRTFHHVRDRDGNNLLDEQGNGTEQFYDSIRGINLTFVYEKRDLKKVFYNDQQGKLIFQFCDRNAEIKSLKSTNTFFDKNYEYPLEALERLGYGILLVKYLIGGDGKILDMVPVKEIDVACQQTLLKLVGSSKSPVRWSPAKDGGANVVQEIIVPYNFSIVSYSPYINHYYNNQLYNSQWLMMQQTLRPNIPMPSIPFH